MNEDHEVELSESELRALRSLQGTPQPSGGLEDRVVQSLRRRGLLRGGAGLPRRWLLAGAALAATLIFLTGIAVGSRGHSLPPPAPGERFVLFLYEGDTFRAPSPGTEPQRVAEYREWARGLAASGTLVAGEKLKDGEQVLGLPAVPEPALGAIGGFFIISARNEEEAGRIASTCPHLKYGGRIVLRQIDSV